MRYKLLLLACLCANLGYAQVSTGSNGITLLSGTTFSFEGLALVPGTDITISNNLLERTATPATSASLNSISRVYTLTSPLSFTGSIAISYLSGELNGNSEAAMQLAYNSAASGGTWTISTGSTQGTAGSFSVSNSFTGINAARFTAFDPSSALPILLEKFEGRATAGGNLLNWSTSLETNVQEIQLERSANSISYTKIAGFASNGSASNYTYLDKDATGIQYYRLKTVDNDGSFEYSHVVRLSNTAQELQLQLSPNPTPGQLKINASITQGQVMLHNAQGQKVLQQNWKQGQMIDVHTLPTGTYVVTLFDGQQRFVGKIMKQ